MLYQPALLPQNMIMTAAMAATEPDETRSRLKQLMSYLRWTLDFALVYSGHHEGNTLDVYTDASWSPTGEKSHILVFARTSEET
eukprot:5632571-Amphidinium_carterae.3